MTGAPPFFFFVLLASPPLRRPNTRVPRLVVTVSPVQNHGRHVPGLRDHNQCGPRRPDHRAHLARVGLSRRYTNAHAPPHLTCACVRTGTLKSRPALANKVVLLSCLQSSSCMQHVCLLVPHSSLTHANTYTEEEATLVGKRAAVRGCLFLSLSVSLASLVAHLLRPLSVAV